MPEAYKRLQGTLSADHRRAIKAIKSLIDPYEHWHAAEPGSDVRRDFAAKAAEWRAKLPVPGTQPAEDER